MRAETEISLKSTKDRLWFLGRVFRKYLKELLFFLVLELAFAGLSAAIPYFTKMQIDQLQLRATGSLTQHTPFFLFRLAILAPMVFEFVRRFVLEKSVRSVKLHFERKLSLETEKLIWQKLDTLDAGFFENKRNQQLMSWFLGSSKVSKQAYDFFQRRFSSVVTILAIIPLLGLVSWKLMVMVVVATLVQMLLDDFSQKQRMALGMIENKQNERLWRVSRALQINYQILRIFGATTSMLKEYHRLNKDRDTFQLEHDSQQDLTQLLQWLISSSLTLVASVYVGSQVFQGTVSLGTFSLVLAYTMQLGSLFRNLAESVIEWQEISIKFDELQFFFGLKSRIKISENPIKMVAAPHLLSLQNVHFTYPNLFSEERSYVQMMIAKTKSILKSRSSYQMKYALEDWEKMLAGDVAASPVLQGTSIQIEKGKIVALLGRNGAGKTTITQLLLHQYEPSAGDVLLDGKPVFEYQQHELLQLFGVVQQHPFILDQFSIKENLLLGVGRQVGDAEMWQLLGEMGLEDKMRKLPKQLDTVLGEDTSFSGGQEQLLAVARILLQKRPFLIFDEGMNQLDIEHETKIIELLSAQKKESGVLFITHRITTARKADYIYMLDEGKIAEEGTHLELMKLDGLYAKFWKMQVIE